MTEIKQYMRAGQMIPTKNGGWVTYDDHRLEVDRLAAELSAARAALAAANRHLELCHEGMQGFAADDVEAPAWHDSAMEHLHDALQVIRAAARLPSSAGGPQS